MTQVSLPRPISAVTDGAGNSTRQWYAWFQTVDSNLGADGVQGEISEIATILGSPDGTVSAIPPLSFDVGKITGYGSIFASGQLPNLVQISLVNDTTAPPNTSVYGADTTGNPGWYPLFDGFATTTLSLTQDATTGIVSFDLPVITPAAGGTLQKYGFDTYGRMDQESSATTDDLTEGATNLYFTNARAQDATGLAIAAGTQTGITVTYNSGSHSIDFFVAPADFASKAPVSYAATAALPANTYSNGSSGVGATLTGNVNGPLLIDGVTMLTANLGERVLIAAEVNGANNGWYVITQIGVVAVSPYILTRSTDADTGAEIGPGFLTTVEAPSGLTPGSNNGKVFVSIAPVPFTVGTDTVTFSAVGSSGGVSSVFGRTGIVVAAANDYTFAQIGSTPTTLSGYGITDGLKASNNLSDVASASASLANLGGTQPINEVWASPSSGSAGAPAFRALVAADVPFAAAAFTRSTVAVTSSSGAAQNGTITMGKQVTLLNLSSNAPLRIRLYTTVAAQTADQSRPVAQYPAPGSGLLFEGVTTASLPAFDISSADAFNNESTVTTAIAYRLEPATAVSTTATFTFTVTQS